MQVSVLGPVRADGPEGEIDLGRPLHRRVLACLAAAHGAPVPFQSLIDQVWGERGTSSGNLHAVVSRLRDRLGDAAVATENAAYRLALGPDDLDVEVFAREVRQARDQADPVRARQLLDDALARWRGPAYADVPLAFAEQEAARLEELRLIAVELLAELDLERGDHVGVIARVAPVVATHPLREPLRASLVLALYRAGRQADALASYDEGRRALVEELGVDPGPALRRLHQRILEQDPALLPRSPEPVVGSRDVALVGRRREAETLDAVLRRGPGTAQVAVVAGEAGIGKTSLVEAVTAAVEPSAVVAFGRCWDHVGVPPLWPWEQLLGSLAEQVGETAVAQALEGRGAPAAMLVHGGTADLELQSMAAARTRLYDGVAAFLSSLASRRRLVLVLEDMHWADAESVALAEYVAAALDDVRLALVVTLRDPAGPSNDERDPAGDLVAALTRQRHLTRVDLAGLDVDDVRDLARRHTGATVDDQVAAQLWARTEGNPFYVEELARLVDDERQAAGHADVPVPPSVRAVIERRLRHLPTAEQELLRVASVSGRSVDIALISQVLDRPRFDVVGSLDLAVRAGLVVSDGVTGEPRFSHALVQETLVASLSAHRAAVVHARLAAALEQWPVDDPAGVARIAHHHLSAGGAGDPERAFDWALRAARLAEGRLSLGESERLVRRALDVLPAVDPARRGVLELEARLRLAALLTQRLGYSSPDVDVAWQAALRLAQEHGSVEEVMAALWGVWHNAIVSDYVGDHSGAFAVCDVIEARAHESGHPAMTALLHVARGQTLWHGGRIQESHAELTRAVELTDRLDDAALLRVLPQHPGAQARAWLAMTTAMTVADPAASDAVVRAVQEQCAALDHLFTTIYTDVVLALRGMWLGRPEEARDLSDRATEAARRSGLRQLEIFAILPAGWSDLVLDQPERGADRLEEMVSLWEAMDGHLPFGAWLILSLLATARAATGDSDGARRWVARARTSASRQEAPRHLPLVDEVERRVGAGPLGDDVRRDLARRIGRALLVAMGDAPV